MADSSNEVAKLQRHLTLLREEYVKLQNKFSELEKKYNVSVAGKADADSDTFICKLLKIIADLFDKELYSDFTVKLNGRSICAHRFIFAAHSNNWGIQKLSDASELDLSHLPFDVGLSMLRWVYTDEVDLSTDDEFILELMRAAKNYELLPLMHKCEQSLMPSVNVMNCVKFYQVAEEINAKSLYRHCSELLSAHWDDFTCDDFVHMSAPLLYKMLKSKSDHLLHSAIKLKREDVVFLFLIEFDSELPNKLNEIDSNGNLPLDLALKEHQDSIAKSLISNRVNVDATDTRGYTLLHKAIERLDRYSSLFLIENGANVNIRTPVNDETPLHILGSVNAEKTVEANMKDVAVALLKANADPNLQDCTGNTVIHRTVSSKNKELFSVIIENGDLKLETKNLDGHTVLWFALENDKNYDDSSFVSQLVCKGSCIDSVTDDTGDSLLHLAAKEHLEEAGIFLVNRRADVNRTNMKGETPLHLSSAGGLTNLTKSLLDRGADPNIQTSIPTVASYISDPFGEEDKPSVSRLTPLQLAIINKHESTIAAFLDRKGDVKPRRIQPDFNIKNSEDQTSLGLALQMGLHSIAEQLLAGGASVDVMNSEGQTLLHEAILNQDKSSALFLLNNGADINVRTRDGDTHLQLAIKRHLPVIVDALCTQGVDMRIAQDVSQLPLWLALDSGQEDIASILVKHGCDTDCWDEGPGDCHQTLLHRAIDENNEAVGCFLIRSGCDVNAVRRPSPDGRGGEEAYDKMTPLHLSCAWGLELIVQTLVEHNADVNAQDAEGKTSLHLAIENQHLVIISLLLSHPNLNLTIRDKQGMSPFSVAMTMKNNRAAQGILDRESTAAEQHDNKGRNFLHLAIQKNDIESVLFLIGIQVNVESRIKDSSNLTPLHLAVQFGSEIIVRNLLLAGAHVNEITPQKQTALHLAAARDYSTICSILIENNVDFDAVDENSNNALHVAVQKCNLATCRVLLTESQVQAETVNLRGQNPLHILGQYGKENAAAIFELFIQCMPNFPINKPDAEGNTPLLLAYMNGNGNLCRAIVKEGACLGTINRQGVNIFNYQVATKTLMFRLLDSLSKEPMWADAETCLECSSKFGITNRKHHCRHCGRLLCAKCSCKDMPILKFNLTKPVRVCEICFDVLTLGSGP